jgi:hypothetical protein
MHVIARWCVTHRLVVVGLWLLVVQQAVPARAAGA